ncbi:uncharacterized protein BDW47DRAFT_97352 [Aspergillus candidus]|uniref:Uncharacterized protein n=1 Tax=Aspergillus candidus TaxID=41067 RepID=A0A2I2FPH6_ASPCN|nr:hypothetical protein BDW47DRAFT_97352 [Aspergillus candidus]PLB42529.1 hypothetical protein BDW47DRAFT_97352 [Aspergillus candidus]
MRERAGSEGGLDGEDCKGKSELVLLVWMLVGLGLYTFMHLNSVYHACMHACMHCLRCLWVVVSWFYSLKRMKERRV